MKPKDPQPERSSDPAPDDTAEASLWEQFLARGNLAEALRRVEQNAGAPGIDGMSTRELRPWLHDHWPQIRSQLDAGTYRPQPVRRVMIPRRRKLIALGIPADEAHKCACSRKGSGATRAPGSSTRPCPPPTGPTRAWRRVEPGAYPILADTLQPARGGLRQERWSECDRMCESHLNLAADAVRVRCDAELAQQRAEVEVDAFAE